MYVMRSRTRPLLLGEKGESAFGCCCVTRRPYTPGSPKLSARLRPLLLDSACFGGTITRLSQGGLGLAGLASTFPIPLCRFGLSYFLSVPGTCYGGPCLHCRLLITVLLLTALPACTAAAGSLCVLCSCRDSSFHLPHSHLNLNLNSTSSPPLLRSPSTTPRRHHPPPSPPPSSLLVFLNSPVDRAACLHSCYYELPVERRKSRRAASGGFGQC